MATLKMGSTTVLTDTTLANAVQDNVTRLGTVTAGNIDAVSDVVKIASGAIPATSLVDIQGCFTSDYKFYKLFACGFAVDGNGYLEVGFLDSTNAHLTSTYYSKYIQMYGADWTDLANPETINAYNQHSAQGFHIVNTWYHHDDAGPILEMGFYDPNLTTKQHVWWKCTFEQSSYMGLNTGMGMYSATVAKHGLRLVPNTGTLKAMGHYALYGYKI